MASARRIGAPDAKNRGVLLDAAEQLLLEEGYAAVTSRRVAERAGLKPQLVHYYFRTMEDLFLEVFRRRAEEGLGVLRTALESPQPLWALWRFSTMPEATRLTMEFMGLANHRKALRAEIVYYAERFREEQNKAIASRAGTLRRGHLGRPAGRLDGVRDERVTGHRHGTGARHVLRSRRDIQVLRGMAAPTRRRTTSGAGRLPVAKRAERTFRALMGLDDDAVHGERTVDVGALR